MSCAASGSVAPVGPAQAEPPGTSAGDVLARLLTDEGLADPCAVYAELRADPAAPPRLVHDHAGVRAVLADPRTSSDRVGAILSPLTGEQRADAAAAERLMRDIVVFRDAPDHTRVRGVLLDAFTGPALHAARALVARETAALLDELVDSDAPDVHAALSYPLPMRVVAALLGIPDEHREAFTSWALDLVLVTGSGRTSHELVARLAADVDSLRALLLPLVEQRRRAPGEDLLSAMASTGELSTDEVLANALFLMTAGHETATNQLSNAVLALLAWPDQLALLRAEPDRWARAAQELVRYDAAVQITARRATVDGDYAGRALLAGQSLVLMLGAANHDPAVFADPQRLDVTRRGRGHVGFGHGAHRCLGAALAGLELEVCLPMLFDALPGLRVTGPVRYQPTLDFRGPEALPVAW